MSCKTSPCEGRKQSVTHQSDVAVPLGSLNGLDGVVQDEFKRKTHMRKYIEVFIAEVIGTAFLMLIGCSALVKGFNTTPIGPAYVPVCFGMAVTIVIQIVGHVSAAHLNPAVTTAFLVLGEISLPMFINYIIAEIIGANLGIALIKSVTPESILNLPGNEELCCTVPHASLTAVEALLVEFLATSFLIFLVCSACDPVNASKQDGMALKFGIVVTVVSNVFGPYTGSSLNPARSLAPAIWHGVWTNHWVYWLGPMAAGLVVPLVYVSAFQSKNVSDSVGKSSLFSKLKL